MNVTGPPVVVALSGGVDSAVAAALLRKEGREVVGVTLQLQKCRAASNVRSCCGADGLARARAVAGRLGIPHHVLDLAGEFDELVLRPAWEDYAGGRTPNPCLLCNERVKFGLLLAWSLKLGASRLATGHYARIGDGPALLRGMDREKDQSYFLAGLAADQLRSVLFPVGHLRKGDVRALAREAGLPAADAPESQDACLIRPGQVFSEMLRERFIAARRPGPVVDDGGRKVGSHEGIHLFTLGQHRGLPIRSPGRRWVRAISADTSTITVTADEKNLFADRFTAGGMNWVPYAPVRCEVQVRHRHAPVEAMVEGRGTSIVQAVLSAPVRAITPGQAAVFYDGDRVLGRGWIRANA